jgi:predicted dehydrogenase
MKDTERSEQASRRDFLKTAGMAGAAVAAVGLPGCAPSGKGSMVMAPTGTAAKRDKLRLAYIGTGGIGGYHLDSTKEMEIVCPCYCDVDTKRMGKAAELHPNAKRYQDYREMFDKEHKNIDAVMVGIPDHSHYPATMIAMQLGIHVYTQKPLTHTPWEARQLAKAAEKYKLVTQMGNQGHANEGWRLVYEWIHSGALGDVLEAHTWTDRPIWPQGVDRPEGEDPVPSSVNWDCWIGPSNTRPYKKDVYHPFKWRGWWDFGNGALGDMACHTMDGVFWALDPGHASSVEPICATPVNDETFPKASAIKWEFPRRGSRKAFTAYWYDGGLKPEFPAEFESGRKLPSTGNLFIGTKASLVVAGDYGNSPRIFPETLMKDIGKPPKMLERSPGHIDEWVMACRGEKPMDFPKSNFAYAGPMSETILLGNIALRVGRRLEWDGEKMEFTNFPEANQYVTKEYRDGWKYTL